MKSLSKNKQGIFSNLGALGIGIASFTILMAVIFLVIAQVNTQIVSTQSIIGDNTTTALNATREMTSAVATIPGWIPLIVIVMIGGLILTLVAAFGGINRR